MSTTADPVNPPPPTGRRHVPIGCDRADRGWARSSAVIALAPLLGGGFLLWANGTQRDDDGYFTTSTERFETDHVGHHLRADRPRLGPLDDRAACSFGDTTVRLQVQSTSERPAFVGIARQDDVDRYLAGVAHAELQRRAGAALRRPVPLRRRHGAGLPAGRAVDLGRRRPRAPGSSRSSGSSSRVGGRSS